MALRLGAELRRLRTLNAMTVASAAKHMSCSGSKISRQECGKANISSEDLEHYIQTYNVPEADRDELRELLGVRNVRDWWTRYDDILSPAMASFIALENQAATEYEYQLGTIPGLLQTRALARILNRKSLHPLDDYRREASVEVRLRRQRRLFEEPKLELRALIWEAAFHVDIGEPEVMREQLEHLIAMSLLPNITFQIIPFRAGTDQLMGSSFQLLDFADPRDPVQMFVESLIGTLSRPHTRDTEPGLRMFRRIADSALTPQQSRALLTQHLKGYR
ncbi:helix-turn-helix domain-containing protein [Yinghuangia soli]|uniref:Helix-turn-helix domain-containing protein n=1 Tax=Yinghuangia soli TaxID=2908204 RepID=A0AA41PZ94_9ACTN|nr:helix-turn-helix transcriptional regulator [Yinghuangia soli]MCF2528664.1 helix-turn-helix domain-containing protein [Yinghuangia soli]